LLGLFHLQLLLTKPGGGRNVVWKKEREKMTEESSKGGEEG